MYVFATAAAAATGGVCERDSRRADVRIRRPDGAVSGVARKELVAVETRPSAAAARDPHDLEVSADDLQTRGKKNLSCDNRCVDRREFVNRNETPANFIATIG